MDSRSNASLDLFKGVGGEENVNVVLACRCSLRLLGSRFSMSMAAIGFTDIQRGF